MNKPLLLRIASDSGSPLSPIIVDMDKIVAMYEEEVDDRVEKGKKNSVTKLLPTAGRHLQVMEPMMEIMSRLFPDPDPETDKIINSDPRGKQPTGEIIPGFTLIESHKCENCGGDCSDDDEIHICNHCHHETHYL